MKKKKNACKCITVHVKKEQQPSVFKQNIVIKRKEPDTPETSEFQVNKMTNMWRGA